MHRVIHRTLICFAVLAGLSMNGYSGEGRNFWAECFAAGQASQDAFVAYVDGLSVEEVLVLSKQGAEECERKLQGASADVQARVEGEYAIALGIVLGRFVERADVADAVRLFVEAIRDSGSRVLYRKAFIRATPELQEGYPEIVRWGEYALVGILGDLLKSPGEDVELREQACRAAGLILQRELKRPSASDEEKKVLANRIRENMEVCRAVLNETNEDSALRDVVAGTLRRYQDAGIAEGEENR